ncbi:hypothetical protein HK099_007677, partial [Clydaea vesicula]
SKVTKQKKVANTFTLNCSGPSDDKIFNVATFEKFLHDRIKVAGRTNNLGSAVTIKRDGSSVSVTAAPGTPFSKRYLKYLTKKYLKKENLRDWLRVLATGKSSYELKYFNIEPEGGAEDEE